MKIWVFAESENSNPTTATLEMVTKARELGGTIEAVYVGTDADAVATGLGEYGVSKVHAVDPQGGLVGVVGAAAIAGLVAAEAPEARRVRIVCGGRAIPTLGGHVPLDRPLDPRDWP